MQFWQVTRLANKTRMTTTIRAKLYKSVKQDKQTHISKYKLQSLLKTYPKIIKIQDALY